MNNLIKGEFFKIRKNLNIKLYITIILISSIIFCGYFQICIQKNPQSFHNISGIRIFYSLLSSVVYQNFLYALIAAIFICKDFQNQTINKIFTFGYKRIEILLSKFFVYLIICIVTFYAFTLFSTIIFSLFHGFGEDLNTGFILILLKSILVNILGIITISSITFFISILSRKSILTIISPLIIFIIFMNIANVKSFIISNLLPFNLVIDALNNKVRLIDFIYLLISCIITTTLSLYLSNHHIKKLEFK